MTIAVAAAMFLGAAAAYITARRVPEAKGAAVAWAVVAAIGVGAVTRILFYSVTDPIAVPQVNRPVEAGAADFAVGNDVRGLQAESSLDALEANTGQTNVLVAFGDSVPLRSRIKITGWIVDARTHCSGKAMYLDIDGTRRIVGRYGHGRPDVAAALHEACAQASGFVVELPASRLGIGTHSVRVGVIVDRGAARYESVRRYRLVVVP